VRTMEVSSYAFGVDLARASHRVRLQSSLAGTSSPLMLVLDTGLPTSKHRSIVDRASPVLVVLPLVSYYSHLGASLWSGALRTVCVACPSSIPEGSLVLVIHDEQRMLIAESEHEEASLASEFELLTDVGTSMGASPSAESAGQVRLVAEVTTAEELRRAGCDGADGMSVIKAEVLERDLAGSRDLVATASELFPQKPRLIRFFDGPSTTHIGPYCVSEPIPGNGFAKRRGTSHLDPGLLSRFEALLDRIGARGATTVLPMVASVREVVAFQALTGSTRASTGITVETPAAALRIEELLPYVSAVEIGIGDLTQFTMGWNRNLPNPDRLPADRIAEPVAELVERVTQHCRAADTFCALGLDLRPSFHLSSQLLELGVRTLSCPAALIGRWRTAFARRRASDSTAEDA
jgi:hypothetical protein